MAKVRLRRHTLLQAQYMSIKALSYPLARWQPVQGIYFPNEHVITILSRLQFPFLIRNVARSRSETSLLTCSISYTTTSPSAHHHERPHLPPSSNSRSIPTFPPPNAHTIIPLHTDILITRRFPPSPRPTARNPRLLTADT
jgi:hypothetical protein